LPGNQDLLLLLH